MTELDRCKWCKSPAESKIRNFFGDNAWIEIAFIDISGVAVDVKDVTS